MGGGNKAEETERLASTPADSRPKVNCKTQALLTGRTDVQGEVSDVPDEQQSCCCAASCRVTRAFLLSWPSTAADSFFQLFVRAAHRAGRRREPLPPLVSCCLLAQAVPQPLPWECNAWKQLQERWGKAAAWERWEHTFVWFSSWKPNQPEGWGKDQKQGRQVFLSCCVHGRKERYGLQDDCLCPLFLLSLLAGSFPFFPTHIYSSCFACESHTKRISKAAGSTSSFSRKTGGPGDFGLWNSGAGHPLSCPDLLGNLSLSALMQQGFWLQVLQWAPSSSSALSLVWAPCIFLGLTICFASLCCHLLFLLAGEAVLQQDYI